jgi:hypothetical protein
VRCQNEGHRKDILRSRQRGKEEEMFSEAEKKTIGDLVRGRDTYEE